MANKTRTIARIVDAFEKAERKLKFFARRIRKVNGACNVKDIRQPQEQVWVSILPNQDEMWDSDDDDNSMNTTQREFQHINVEGRVDKWLQGCQESDRDPITLGQDEKELATLYNASVEEEPWPEHLLNVNVPPFGNEVPTFEQMEFKRQLALIEAQEMGWEIMLEETPVRDMEPVHLSAGQDW
ncbi:hypothetical protein L211DRAFT_850515 [Terfezia boudieri ATCC MYA-4762]|uniref:Uncharacterized protein n=1 Tax=Terfezia boudieri ATCC MYA-4762 TaxID=1051890 RepID=A0A3N4LWQ5_9PEZI|nr:hypothetical protein L211DRAFT_850515 [Terfezia boudieri ATCC MYA-4762]